MTTDRPRQGSLYPDLVPERPFGPIVGSVIAGTNADLIACIAPLYLTGSVLDVTYGTGGWWRRFKPDPFAAHDLYKLDGVDCRALPEPDDSVDAVCFDPPYVPQGGMSTATKSAPAFRDRFGLSAESQPWQECQSLMVEGLAECARVSRRWVLAKCSDFVTGSQFKLGHRWIMDAASACGLGDPWDLIVHHSGSGPGGHNISTVIRARRHHSYLLVFKKPRSRHV